MLISIPAPSTIKQYNQLKTSQKEVLIGKTSKKLDDYVYDKDNKFKNLKTALGLGVINLLFYLGKNKKSPLTPGELWVSSVINVTFLYLMYEDYKNKKRTLNNPDDKLRLYKRNGINATA